MKEFLLINNFFQSRSYQRKDVIMGIGDDCAITQIPKGQGLATTTDTLVCGVHFLPSTSADAIAQKAVAVNLSDLAAMGAEPAWISLSLTLPDVDEEWLEEFSLGIQKMTEYYSIELIGGDTVQGPLSITITAQGFVPIEQAISRNKAMPGDLVYVTGTLGDAGLGLDIALNKLDAASPHKAFFLERLHYPKPRLLAGTTLRRIASSCIDISDGLISDLQHILVASQVGAKIDVDKLPFSPAMLASVDIDQALHYALSAGDDYELLFTVSEEQKSNLEVAFANINMHASCIGQLNGMPEKLALRRNGEDYAFTSKGYQHFS